MTLFKRPSNGPRMAKMAQTIGIELQEATANGQLKAHMLREAATHCGECQGTRDCATWLVTHEDGAAQAPSFCPNRGLYARVKAAQDKAAQD